MVIWDIHDTGSKVIVSKGDVLKGAELVTVYRSPKTQLDLVYQNNKIATYIITYLGGFAAKNQTPPSRTGPFFALLYRPLGGTPDVSHEVVYEDQSLRFLAYHHNDMQYPDDGNAPDFYNTMNVRDYYLVGRWKEEGCQK